MKRPVKSSARWEIHVVPDPMHSAEWRVEYFDNEGGCYVTIFSGPAAEQRARDYGLAIRNGGLRRCEA